jgi:LPXTG-motif cell wall-anchored protein
MAVNSSPSGFDPYRQISRRRLLRRVGQGSILAGTLTWVAPIVMTIDPAGASPGSTPPQSSTTQPSVLPNQVTAGQTLPRTGSSSTTPLVVAGGGLVAAGAGALLASDKVGRDRRRARPEPPKDDSPGDTADTEG